MLLMTDESRRAKPEFSVIWDTQEEIIQPYKSEKLLGKIMSQNHRFSDQIVNDNESVLEILNTCLKALKKLFKVASVKRREMDANGILISRFPYLIPITL